MIDRITADKIKEAAQIVDVVSDFVALKRSGANFKGLCPFHDDKTPSFMVSPAKNYCKCFACGKGGNPIGFIMEHEQMSYPDALRYLAKKYGIAVEERELSPEEKAAQNERDSMFILNDWALRWFVSQLHDSTLGRTIGLAYFRERGFRDDIIRKFQLGFCPDSRDDMTQAALKEGFREDFLTGTGLTIKREDGRLCDRFWGRVMFPWHTVGGKVCGFGGRVLNAATKGVAVKYQNSPESSIFSKRRELYGLYQAKTAINKLDLVYMVEGYTDVISMHQCGIENVVANSGTALTKEQIHLLHRFTNNVTLLYDGDDAGIHAAQRGTDMFLQSGMNVRILLLPDGDDPDSFARKLSAEEFRSYVEEHQVDFIKFKTDLLMEGAKGDPVKLGGLINEVVTSIAVIPDEITRSLYIREAAQTMMMDEQIIVRAVQSQMSRNREDEYKRRNGVTPLKEATMEGKPETVPVQPAMDSRDDKMELLLAQMVVKYGGIKVCEAVDENGVEIPLTVAEYIFHSLAQDGVSLHNDLAKSIIDETMLHVKEVGFDSVAFFLEHSDRNLSAKAFELMTDREQLSRMHDDEASFVSAEKLLDRATHLLADMKLSIVRKEIKSVMEKIKSVSPGDANAQSLLMRFKELKESEGRLAKVCGDRVM